MGGPSSPKEDYRLVGVVVEAPGGNVFFKLTGPEALDEFQELARSAGAEVVGIVTAPRDRPDARYFVGSGKIDEVAQQVAETGAGLVDRLLVALVVAQTSAHPASPEST